MQVVDFKTSILILMGKVWTREGWTGGVWMGGAWILERGWVVCGRLIRGRVLFVNGSRGVVSDDVLLGEVGAGEPSKISNIAVAVGVMGAI
ncbi:hypothetical protein F2Q69_00035761 [Brassica cretica]|uniref:Uncharacterized protein n=1 Tax=Brassica cretica TaxID=69181 RepID=A0A8S9SM25_BRACR|nr:hypothetical protein F2Q69_00035761 [Brassica cretica]